MLSVIILTHNNKETLEKTLASVAFCDEIIVIDDYSTDATVTLAKKHHANVYQRHLSDDFSGQRNFGLSKATHEWVLFIDSDESIPEALKKEILENISQEGDQYEGSVGYILKRQDIFFGKPLLHGETACIQLVRLGKKDAGKWIRPIHEIWDIPGQKKVLMTPLVHIAHTDLREFVADINRYTTMNAAYLYGHHVSVSLWSILTYPSGKFIQNYFLRRGFLDGTAGFIMAMMMSLHSFLTRSKLYMLYYRSQKSLHI